MRKIKILLLVAFVAATPTFASGFSDLSIYLINAHTSMIKVIKQFFWLFAILPAVVVGYAEVKAREKLRHDFEQRNRGRAMGGKAGLDLDSTFLMVVYAVGSLFAVYIMYGIFGHTFADLSFEDTWRKLVSEVWEKWIVGAYKLLP